MNIKLGEQLSVAAFSISIPFKNLYLVKMCPIFTLHCTLVEQVPQKSDFDPHFVALNHYLGHF